MYIYLFCMILNHIFLQIYFENFPSPEKFHLIYCFRPGGRPAGSTGFIPGQAGRPTGRPRPVFRTRTLVHVCRSTDLKQLALCFCRSTDRSTVSIYPLRPVGDRSTESNGYMPKWATGRPAGRPIVYLEPQRLFPLW